MRIGKFEKYVDGDFKRLENWLPVIAIDTSGNAEVSLLFLAGPGLYMPISITPTSFARQIVQTLDITFSIKQEIWDWILAELLVSEADALSAGGYANFAAADVYKEAKDLGLIDETLEQLYVWRADVEAEYETQYPLAVGRQSVDRAGLITELKNNNVSALETAFNEDPDLGFGLTWQEVCAYFHVNLDEESYDKTDSLTAAKSFVDTNL